MLSKLRPFAVVALVAVAGGFAWLIVSDFQYTGTPLWPNENTLILAWLLYVLWEVSLALPLLGFWLLFVACRGGGRWWWRWWVGGLIVVLFCQSLLRFLFVEDWGPGFMTGHPEAKYVLAAAAILPLWIVAARREAR
jgi:hypothetical protein